jgi:hypothetical protein
LIGEYEYFRGRRATYILLLRDLHGLEEIRIFLPQYSVPARFVFP